MPDAHRLKDEGLALFRQERLPEAAERFLAAAELFGAQGQRDQQAEMLNNVCVVRLAEQDWEAALQAAAGTPDVFRAHGDTLREAQACSNLAAAHDGAGRLEQAAELYVRAIELFTQLGERPNRAACWKALSGLQIKQNKQLQALASMRAGLGLSEKLSAREKSLKGLIDRAFKMMDGRPRDEDA